MKKENFVAESSIVRKIWGNGDIILLIFAGASAEFALNKAVDWLYFTGKLPSDPLGRLFSTVAYARKIVFCEKRSAIEAVQNINSIHANVESNRGKKIPEWAYRDVLFMLIDYSIRSHEILERRLKPTEKQETLEVFTRVGNYMNLTGLPATFEEFEEMRKTHLEQHLYYGDYSKRLYRQYRKHLGFFRYKLLLESQVMITPARVRNLLLLRRFSLLTPLIFIYKVIRSIHLDWVLKSLLLPSKYKKEIRSMDRVTT